MSALITLTPQGLHCAAGGFHVDPKRAVDTALITHAHSDHARRGAKRYFCAPTCVGLLKARLGPSIRVEAVPYGQEIRFNDVKVSFHPAGHILGSAQIRVESGPEVWVLSGDYKRAPDPSCEPFEVVPCDTFVTEATFGNPLYEWDREYQVGEEIAAWWRRNAERGLNSVLYGYSLGKTQRILAELHGRGDRDILLHSAAQEITDCYRREGIALAPTVELEKGVAEGRLASGRELVLAPPATSRNEWMRQLGGFRTAFASGWMQQGARRWGGGYDHGFVVSDHADWPDLLRTVSETGARRVFVAYAQCQSLVRHLRKEGLDAHPVEALAAESPASQRASQLSLF